MRDPRRRVEALALRKAEAVAKKLNAGWVLGADTLVVLGRRVLGKPVNALDAYRMLYRLSGTRHRVMTGVALVEAGSGRRLVGSALSTVFMKKLELEEIVRLSRRHLDKAGAYAIQEKRDPIARVLSGSYDNVVGLPVALVRELLRRFALPAAGSKKKSR
jgi:septum formation protein